MTDLRTGSNLPYGLLIVTLFLSITASAQLTREKISINKGWHFFKGDPADAKGIFYSVRPKVSTGTITG